jgi:hypothetical protein
VTRLGNRLGIESRFSQSKKQKKMNRMNQSSSNRVRVYSNATILVAVDVVADVACCFLLMLLLLLSFILHSTNAPYCTVQYYKYRTYSRKTRTRTRTRSSHSYSTSSRTTTATTMSIQHTVIKTWYYQ